MRCFPWDFLYESERPIGHSVVVTSGRPFSLPSVFSQPTEYVGAGVGDGKEFLCEAWVFMSEGTAKIGTVTEGNTSVHGGVWVTMSIYPTTEH